MTKININLSAVLVILAIASSISITHTLGGQYPMQRPMQGGQYPAPGAQHPMQGQSKDQRKAMKKDIKREQKRMYFQRPGATKQGWETYWDNYKRENRLKG